jgi:hypothetical protein
VAKTPPEHRSAKLLEGRGLGCLLLVLLCLLLSLLGGGAWLIRWRRGIQWDRTILLGEGKRLNAELREARRNAQFRTRAGTKKRFRFDVEKHQNDCAALLRIASFLSEERRGELEASVARLRVLLEEIEAMDEPSTESAGEGSGNAGRGR